MPGGDDAGSPPQGQSAPEGLLGPDSQPTPQSPTGQNQEEIVKAQMRRFHDLEQQIMRTADLEKDAMNLAATFPQIAQEMRGVGQLLQPLKGVTQRQPAAAGGYGEGSYAVGPGAGAAGTARDGLMFLQPWSYPLFSDLVTGVAIPIAVPSCERPEPGPQPQQDPPTSVKDRT